MNSESRLVTYVNKKGERQTLPLSHALESNNAEMTKRLKYTKDILTHMLNNNNNNGGGVAAAPLSSISAKGGVGGAQQPTALSQYQTTSSRGPSGTGLNNPPQGGSLAASGLSSKRTLVSQGLGGLASDLHGLSSGSGLRPISSSKG